MSDQYVGEIRMFSGNYAPEGWHFCDGSLLSIDEYDVLYALIGVTYGGDGINNFRIPDMRGRVPLHNSGSYRLAQMGGAEAVTLAEANLPAHTHTANANNVAAEATSASPEGQYWGYSAIVTNYQPGDPNVTMNPNAVARVGGSQPHDNMMPSFTVSFIIALQGLFPTQD